MILHGNTGMIVYRIQNKNNLGAYESYAIKHNKFSTRSERLRPTPESDGLLMTLQPHHYFGFRDLTQVKSWFTKEDRRSFRKHGWFLAVYSVPDEYVIKGRKQVIFHWEKATLVKKFDPLKLEPQ